MPNHTHYLAASLILPVMLSGCATITSGTTQNVTVLTEPAGASCTLEREGGVIGVINATPGTLNIAKSRHDITVRCTKASHSEGFWVAPSMAQGMTAGNFILGGMIGLAVDAASGASARYPESVTVILPPESFTNAKARDAFFDGRDIAIRQFYEDRIVTVRGACSGDGRAHCENQAAAIMRERDNELARIERLRQNARISG